MQDSQKDSKTDQLSQNEQPIMGEFKASSWVAFRIEIPTEDRKEWDSIRCDVTTEACIALEKIRRKHNINFAWRVETESPWVGVPLEDI